MNPGCQTPKPTAVNSQCPSVPDVALGRRSRAEKDTRHALEWLRVVGDRKTSKQTTTKKYTCML